MSNIFVFEFSVMDDNEFVYTDGVAMTYSEEDIKKFAEILKGKGEEYKADDLPLDVQQPIIEAILDQYAEKLEDEEGIDLQEAGFYLIGPIPVNLRHACNVINGVVEKDDEFDYSFDPAKDLLEDYGLISCTVKYTVRHDGKEYHETCDYGMHAKIAYAMFHLAPEKPVGISDFDYFKEIAPEMYDYVAYDINVWNNNKHLREWGVCEDIELIDFPVEIYEL